MPFGLVLAMVLATGSPAQPAPSPAVVAKPDRTSPRPGKDTVEVGRYRLQRKAGGGYEATTEVFIADIAADGAVAFKDKKRLPGQAVWPVLVAAEALRSATGAGPRARNPRTNTADLTPSLSRPTLIVTDEDLRRDPHHAAKMTFLETTKDFREELRLSNDRTALGAFERRVSAAARDSRRSPAERRRDLYDLWLDCDEGPRGTPARAAVEETAHRTFPPGSPQAYSAAELTRLNADSPAGLRFAPYPAAPAPAPTKD